MVDDLWKNYGPRKQGFSGDKDRIQLRRAKRVRTFERSSNYFDGLYFNINQVYGEIDFERSFRMPRFFMVFSLIFSVARILIVYFFPNGLDLLAAGKFFYNFSADSTSIDAALPFLSVSPIRKSGGFLLTVQFRF